MLPMGHKPRGFQRPRIARAQHVQGRPALFARLRLNAHGTGAELALNRSGMRIFGQGPSSTVATQPVGRTDSGLFAYRPTFGLRRQRRR